RLACVETLHDFGRRVPDPDVRYVDQRTGIRFYRVTRIDIGEAVFAPDQLPVCAARQDFAADTGAFDRASENVDDASRAVRQLTDDQRVGDLSAYLEREFQLGRLHRFLSLTCHGIHHRHDGDDQAGEV